LSKTIGEIQKNVFEKVVVTLIEHHGKQRIDIRTYVINDQGDPDRQLPSKKGVNLSLDMWEALKELIEKIDQALGDKP